MAWTQQAGILLGHEAAAVLAVVTAFMAGLALGALAFGEWVARSARPLRTYVLCELLIAFWAALSPGWVDAVAPWLLQALGSQASPALQWGGGFAVLTLLWLPATVAMGLALPALDRLLGADGRQVAGLYAANTAGALAGVLLAVGWWMPELGLRQTARCCALLNLACAGLVLWRSRAGVQVPLPERRSAARATARATAPADRALLGLLAWSGLLGIGVEVLAVRVLSRVAENTLYTWAALLACYLMGTAAGAVLWQRFAPAAEGRLRGAPWLLAAAGVLACALVLAQADALQTGALHWLQARGAEPLAAALAAETWPAWLAFAPATAAMGALFSHLAETAQRRGLSLGRVFGCNTAGAALAPPLIGLWALPAFGAGRVAACLLLGYLVAGTWLARHGPARAGWAGLALAALVAVALAPDLPRPDESTAVLWRREGALGEVRVLEDADGVRRLQINRRAQEGDNVSRHVDGRQAALPLLLHAAPRRVLMIGLGTGVTARAAAADPQARVEVVELLPEVVAAAPLFAQPAERAQQDRLQVQVADARRRLRTDDGTRWDLVIGDNVHPGRSGTAALYTVEQFRAVRARLAPDGLYVQWLPLHQLDTDSLRGIVQAWMTVFPRAAAVLASHSLDTPVLGLVGRVDGGGADAAPLPAWAVLQQRLREGDAWAPGARPAEAPGLTTVWDVAGSVVADADALRALAGDAAPDTDDRPQLAWQALRVTYAPQASPRERLAGWLTDWSARRESAGAQRLTALFGDVAAGSGTVALDRPSAVLPAEVAADLLTWWAVRDDYLALGLHVHPTADVRGMLAQVQAPLLGLLQRSPGFSPARGALVHMAQALQARDAGAARALRDALAATVPHPP
ncbi:fused MFS/spermidine synthase [Pseudaquabacterium rugosum]|uniref:Fused MFS/spermidine synthase n=1 Tax=Pseudaquabacterium rugosum TaxID=2984194 RepID=A0ABU9B7L0_9BURK